LRKLILLLAFLPFSAYSMSNNDAIKHCWEQHKPNYSQAAGCAHVFIAANTRAEEQKIRDFLKDHPEYRIGKGGRVRIY